MRALWILVAIGVIVLIGLIAVYNRLVGLRQLAKNAWADVDVYLKRRAELIPNLVATVKGYGNYEQAALEGVIAARARALNAGGPSEERAEAEGSLTRGINHVFALAEAYPDLKANQSYLQLQRDLSDTESKIASARQYYNAVVRDYNTALETFPSGLVAGTLGFRSMRFFEVDVATEREAPRVA